MEEELLEELVPGGARFHGWRPVGAIIRPLRWQPVFRRRGSVNEPITEPRAGFLGGAAREDAHGL